MLFTRPGQTAGVILGAHDWPHLPRLNGGKAFCNSAAAVKRYLMDPQGIGLTDNDILDLFDSEFQSAEQLIKVEEFLRCWKMGPDGALRTLTDLSLYYVGHGDFVGMSADLTMMVRASRPGHDLTSIQISALAQVLRNEATFVRQVAILDCCWSGAAHRVWQSGDAPKAAAKRAAELMPSNGTVLLCSSCEHLPSMAPEGAEYTMFTGALIDVLQAGNKQFPEGLSARQVRDLAFDAMHKRWGGAAVRPVVHAIDRGSGDLSDRPLFPNRAVPVKPEITANSLPPQLPFQADGFSLTLIPQLFSQHQKISPRPLTLLRKRRGVMLSANELHGVS